METLLLHVKQLEVAERLSDAELGRLFRFLIDFAKSEKRPKIDDGMLQMCFDFIAVTIESNIKKYAERCERNRKNAKSKWQQLAATRSNSQPLAATRSDWVPNDNDNDNDKKNMEATASTQKDAFASAEAEAAADFNFSPQMKRVISTWNTLLASEGVRERSKLKPISAKRMSATRFAALGAFVDFCAERREFLNDGNHFEIFIDFEVVGWSQESPFLHDFHCGCLVILLVFVIFAC